MTTKNHTSPSGEELKPCPFCGSQHIKKVGYDQTNPGAVRCYTCYAETKSVESWNSRDASGAHANRANHIGEDAANVAIGERAALLADYIELNMSNYGPDDVDRLNAWAIEAYDFISRAALTAEKVAGQEPVARCFRCGHAEHHGSCVNVAPVALNDPNKLRAALQHIERTAQRSREQSRRLRWIELRARSALDGTDDWKVLKLPKNGEHVRRKLQYRIDELQSAVAAPQQPAQSAEQDERAAFVSGRDVEELFLRWSEWTTELGEAISRKNIDGFVSDLRALLAAQPASGGDHD